MCVLARATERQISIWKRLFWFCIRLRKTFGERSRFKRTVQTAIEENGGWMAYTRRISRKILCQGEPVAVWRKHSRKVGDIKGNTDNWFELCQSGTVRQVKIAGLRRCSPQTQSRRRNFAMETAVYVLIYRMLPSPNRHRAVSDPAGFQMDAEYSYKGL